MKIALSEILAQYRAGERGLPSYTELAKIDRAIKRLQQFEEAEQITTNIGKGVPLPPAGPVLGDDTIKALQGMLEDGESEYGIGYCDCQPEPENAGHVCNACKARDVIAKYKRNQ